jgi:hypothetical protein
MCELYKIASVLPYMLVGLVSLRMAMKSIVADAYLPFHEKAAARQWDDIEEPLRHVILSMLRLGGLGFLIVGVMLVSFPVVNYFHPTGFYKYSVPVLALVFCLGLFLNNYWLYRKTGAQTPWKGSLYAMLFLILGLVLSGFQP